MSYQTQKDKKQDFLKRTMSRSERLLASAHMHWIVLLTGFLWFAGLSALGIFLDGLTWTFLESRISPPDRTIWGYQFESRGAVFRWLGVLGGLFIFFRYLVRYATTRMGLTNRRLLIRTGLIFVEVEELDLEEVKSAHVRHGLLGRFLNYGEIHFDARFVGDVSYPGIARPYPFLRAVHEASAKLSDSMHDSFRGHPDIPPPGGRVVSETKDYVIVEKPH